MSAAILIQIVWMWISHRWLSKNFLDVSVFALRKYDVLTGIIIACCIIGLIYMLGTLVGFIPTEADEPAYADIEFVFQFAGAIYSVGYLALSILVTSALIRSERSLNMYNADLPSVAASYMIPLFGLHFLWKRHVALVQRARKIAEAPQN